MTSADRAAALFRSHFGDAAELVWSAPGRVNLIGEHTDYNDGFVLPFALHQRTAVAVARATGARWTVVSEQTGETVVIEDLAPGRPAGWASYVASVIWTLREAGHEIPGAGLAIASDVPTGAGLSSSAALECAVLGALVDLAGADVPIGDRPRLAQRGENAYVGVPCGIMDQAAATLCRAGHLLFLDCRSLATAHVPFTIEERGLAVLVVDTRAPHQHVAGEYSARRSTCEEAARTLGIPALRDVDIAALPGALAKLESPVARRRVRHVVTENQRVLQTVAALRAGDVNAVGPLLTESHRSLRDDYEVSAPELDTACTVALSAGAYGARMTGGGFGGCAIALTDRAAAASLEAEVRAAFSAAGFNEPACFLAVAAHGAARC